MKVNTQLLYTKEQETKLVRDQLQQAENNIDVEVQCRLADRNHELIMGKIVKTANQVYKCLCQ